MQLVIYITQLKAFQHAVVVVHLTHRSEDSGSTSAEVPFVSLVTFL